MPFQKGKFRKGGKVKYKRKLEKATFGMGIEREVKPADDRKFFNRDEVIEEMTNASLNKPAENKWEEIVLEKGMRPTLNPIIIRDDLCGHSFHVISGKWDVPFENLKDGDQILMRLKRGEKYRKKTIKTRR